VKLHYTHIICICLFYITYTLRGIRHITIFFHPIQGANTNITAENDGSGRCEGMDNDSEDASQQPQVMLLLFFINLPVASKAQNKFNIFLYNIINFFAYIFCRVILI
jgi:hypothetical protein